MLTVNYTDKTTAEIPFTAKGVTYSEVDTSVAGSKTITLKYGNKKTTCSINVVKAGGTVTFKMNYQGGEDLKVKVAEGRAVVRPSENPQRTGYTFFNWYTDEKCNVEYNFAANQVINKDIEIYASWKSDSDFVVTYDYNYYGKKVNAFSQIVANGSAARPIAEPQRTEFTFAGWFKDEGLTQQYTDGAPITADTTLRAKWTRNNPGVKEWTFEAENTDLSGKVGPGFSGEAIADGMIVPDSGNALGASNGKFVSYLYDKGLSLEFYVASSEKVTDATLKVSATLDADLAVGSLTLTSDDYQVLVNGVAQDFDTFTVTKESFSEKIVISGITLNEGANLIRLVTNNDRNPLGGSGGTYRGSAPVIDCIRITSSSVLTWDENYGLPAYTD